MFGKGDLAENAPNTFASKIAVNTFSLKRASKDKVGDDHPQRLLSFAGSN